MNQSFIHSWIHLIFTAQRPHAGYCGKYRWYKNEQNEHLSVIMGLRLLEDTDKYLNDSSKVLFTGVTSSLLLGDSVLGLGFLFRAVTGIHFIPGFLFWEISTLCPMVCPSISSYVEWLMISFVFYSIFLSLFSHIIFLT